MKLITKEFVELMKERPLYSQENEKDPLVVAKFFNPCGSGTWLVTEYDPTDKIAFGYVMGLGDDELGYISLEEMESVRLPFGLTIERDLHFRPQRLSECSSFKPRS